MAKDQAPELHLDFAEDLFGAFWRRLRRRGRPGAGPAAAVMEDMETSLAAVVQAFAGRRILLRPAEACGGIDHEVALLPRFIELSADPAVNRAFLYTRAAIAGATLAQPEASRPAASAEDAVGREVVAMHRAAEVAAQLAREHAGFRERLAQAATLEAERRREVGGLSGRAAGLEQARLALLDRLAAGEDPSDAAVALAGLRRLPRRRGASPPLLLLGGPLTPSELEVADQARREGEEPVAGIADDATEVEAPLKDHVKRILLDDDEDPRDGMPEHAFEKVMFAEKYEGGRRRMDGADDMADHQDSLDAVDLRDLIRGGPEVHSVYRADLGEATAIPDVDSVAAGERGLPYPEWDRRARAYRPSWVTVYPSPLHGSDSGTTLELQRRLAPAVRTCMRRLERLRTERLVVGRQADGPEFDLDAVVDEHAELRAGRTPAGKVYRQEPRLRRDLATTVLLDVSLSADGWVQDRRVLDVEREAAFVLGEVADRIGDELQVLAYASNTRNLCRVWTVKDWDEPWYRGATRLGLLKPQGYTRIGAALRHAVAGLAGYPARRRHLILITDAKPTDFDRYEGRHGIEDVRKAVLEAKAEGVAIHALGIDPRSAGILPAMFGVRGWRLLPRLADLPEALVEAYGDQN